MDNQMKRHMNKNLFRSPKKLEKISSAELYGTKKQDYIAHIDENLIFVNFKLHGIFINLRNEHQKNEQPPLASSSD